MGKDERYDFVVVGGGPNGVALSAYLGKCGASVCVLEERPEAGGACENTEPIPGVRITPHAMYMYGGPAPGFEQLELHKYGFRMDWSPMSENLADQKEGGVLTTEGVAPLTDKDAMGWAKISGMLGQPPFIKDLLRSIFWCPPHPPEVEVTAENVPYMQVYKQHQPDVWTEELLDMTMFDLMDEYLETEPFKVMHAMVAWYSGAAGHWEGVAIPALGCDITLTLYSGLSVPRGGMHGYFHSIIRCAIAHGVVVRTCCPVDEIIIEDGRAMGVRLRETATTDEKRIWANKAVISGVDVKQTFAKLVGPQHLGSSFRKKVEDISVKGGSIWVSHLLTREPLRPREKFRAPGRESRRRGRRALPLRLTRDLLRARGRRGRSAGQSHRAAREADVDRDPEQAVQRRARQPVHDPGGLSGISLLRLRSAAGVPARRARCHRQEQGGGERLHAQGLRPGRREPR